MALDLKKKSFQDLVVNNQMYMTYVEFRRPKETRNAVTTKTWEEIEELFTFLKFDGDTRAVVLYSSSADFVGAIEGDDLSGGIIAPTNNKKVDAPRRGNLLREGINLSQNACNAIASCGKPVIVAIQGKCVGLGMDLVAACDIRYCTESSKFKFKDVPLGFASHNGSISRLHKLTGKTGLLNEMLLTGQYFSGALASRCGFVSKVLPDQQSLFESVKKLAYRIAWQNPIDVIAAKGGIDYAVEHDVSATRKHTMTSAMSLMLCDDFLRFEETAKRKDRYARTDYASIATFPPTPFYPPKPKKVSVKKRDGSESRSRKNKKKRKRKNDEGKRVKDDDQSSMRNASKHKKLDGDGKRGAKSKRADVDSQKMPDSQMLNPSRHAEVESKRAARGAARKKT